MKIQIWLSDLHLCLYETKGRKEFSMWNNVLFCRSEQFFGSPSDMASSAENIRDKMKIVEDKRLQEESATHLKEETTLEEEPEES